MNLKALFTGKLKSNSIIILIFRRNYFEEHLMMLLLYIFLRNKRESQFPPEKVTYNCSRDERMFALNSVRGKMTN